MSVQQGVAAGCAALFCAIGAGALAAPRASASQYGLPTNDETALAFVRAAGARDVVLGSLLFASLGDPGAMRRILAVAAAVGLADAAIVATRRGLTPSLALHAGGALVLALGARVTRGR